MINKDLKVAVLGAGAMGCLFGGLLAEKGLNVILIDVWKEHALSKHLLELHLALFQLTNLQTSSPLHQHLKLQLLNLYLSLSLFKINLCIDIIYIIYRHLAK